MITLPGIWRGVLNLHRGRPGSLPVGYISHVASGKLLKHSEPQFLPLKKWIIYLTGFVRQLAKLIIPLLLQSPTHTEALCK